MADTKISALTALTAKAAADSLAIVDDSAGATRKITVASLQAGSSHGGIYVSASAATTLLGTETPTKASGTTTLATGVTASDFDMPANNRLRYTGTPTRTFFVSASTSLICADTSNQVLGIYIAKNGSVVAESEIHHKVGSSGDVSASATSVIVSLATNEYVELWVENYTSTGAITVSKMYLSAIGIY